jgi:hypothetical protein
MSPQSNDTLEARLNALEANLAAEIQRSKEVHHDMQTEYNKSIDDIKGLLKDKSTERRTAYLTIMCVFLSSFLTFLMYIVLHAAHVI